jgi:hypothetical protein
MIPCESCQFRVCARIGHADSLSAEYNRRIAPLVCWPKTFGLGIVAVLENLVRPRTDRVAWQLLLLLDRGFISRSNWSMACRHRAATIGTLASAPRKTRSALLGRLYAAAQTQTGVEP